MDHLAKRRAILAWPGCSGCFGEGWKVGLGERCPSSSRPCRRSRKQASIQEVRLSHALWILVVSGPQGSNSRSRVSFKVWAHAWLRRLLLGIAHQMLAAGQADSQILFGPCCCQCFASLWGARSWEAVVCFHAATVSAAVPAAPCVATRRVHKPGSQSTNYTSTL